MPNASLIKRLDFGFAFFLSIFSGGRLHIGLKNYMGKTSAEFEFYAKFWVDMSNFTGGKFFFMLFVKNLTFAKDFLRIWSWRREGGGGAGGGGGDF